WKYPSAAITARNHRAHIHIAAYANGGIKAADTSRLALQPGLNMDYNGLTRTENLRETLGAAPTLTLPAEDRALLRSVAALAGRDVVVAVDSREIARASARGSAQLGGRLVTGRGL